MALPKYKALLLRGCLLMSLFLSGCGGQALSQREIVRGVFFDRQQGEYSVCLVLADQNAPEGKPEANKVACAAGDTPAQALQHAEKSLSGTVYYGLLDLAGLPADVDWEEARELGMLLYENAQPAPELSLFALDNDPARSWAETGDALYKKLKALEDTAKVHCGLQQLFVQPDVCAIPGYSADGGYDLVLLPRESTPVRCEGLAEAQLAAVLCGSTTRMQGTFAHGAATCSARANVTVQDGVVQLHLREVELRPLYADNADLTALLCQELQTAFAKLNRRMQAAQADPFHLAFWQACVYGPGARPEQVRLNITFE